MGHASAKTSEQIIANQRFTILELLDRLLDKGVVVKGEVLLSVADIDLVYLNLGLLLSSMKTIEQAARKGDKNTAALSWQSSEALVNEPLPIMDAREAAPAPHSTRYSDRIDKETEARQLLATIDDGDELAPFSGPRANIDPHNVEKGLAQLVLTLVELIRKLMEKQAIRRIDAGQLSADDIEKMGNAFLLLDERMEQLKETFGLQEDDLNLDLGPLGQLL